MESLTRKELEDRLRSALAEGKAKDDQIDALQQRVHLCAGYDKLEAECARWYERYCAMANDNKAMKEAIRLYMQDIGNSGTWEKLGSFIGVVSTLQRSKDD